MEIKDLDIRIRICVFTMIIISATVFTSTVYVWVEFISGNIFKMFTAILVNIFCFGITFIAMSHSKRFDDGINRMEEAKTDCNSFKGGKCIGFDGECPIEERAWRLLIGEIDHCRQAEEKFKELEKVREHEKIS